jgi:hypothetical protein
VRFGDGELHVITPGDYVRCAVTDVPIPLPELKYWSVERQEAYASAEIAFRRHIEVTRGGGAGDRA